MCKNASWSLAWPVARRLDTWHDGHGEEPPQSGGQIVGSGVEELPEVEVKDAPSQLG